MGRTRLTLKASAYLLLVNLLHAEQDSARFHLDASTDFAESKASVFKINKRDLDPFGKPQDLTKKVVVEKEPELVAVTPEIEILIEQEITKLAERTSVFRGSMIVDGKRTYRRGQEIEVEVKGEVFPLKIIAIKNKQIKFFNVSGKNLITLDMDNKAILGTSNNERPTLDNDGGTTIILD